MPPEVPEVRYAKSGDIHIAYQVFGKGPVNLVLTPGLLSHISHHWKEPGWRRCLEGLGGFARTAIFDKRGTGLSDRDAGVPGFEERMDDIRAVMDAAGFQDAVLVGFSDGVGMSVLFAASYPSRTRGLVLYGGESKASWAPDHPWEATDEQFAEHLARLERTFGTDEMAKRWVASVAPSRTGDQAFTGWLAELIRLAATPGAAIALAKSNFNMDVRNALQEVHVPTLVIHPTYDKNVDVRGGRYLAEHIPGARLFEFPGEDHWFFVDERQTRAVLKQLERFARGLEPPAKTAGPRRATPGFRERRRVAVLPLVNIGAVPQEEGFADGMTEEMITTISRVPNLSVISRTSVLRYKGSSKGAAEIGRELGVDSLIEGSVRRSSDRVRISVQLIDAQTEEHLWAETFDRTLDDVFRLQEEIANHVAKELKLRLIQTPPDAVRQRAPDANAHTLYLRARYHLNLRSQDGLKEAIRGFEETIEKYPDYSLALVGLAECYHISALYGYTSPGDAYPRARDLAYRALRAGGASAEAHTYLGEFLMHYSYDWAGSARELEKALQINPNYAMAHVWRSTNYAATGQLEGALAEARRGAELDPFAVVAMNEVAKNYYYARLFDDSAVEFARALHVEPDSALLHKSLAETYAMQSMPEEAAHEIERALVLSARSPLYLDSAAGVYALTNNDRRAKEVLSECERLAERRFVPAYGRAAAWALLGDKEKAIELLEKAYDEHGWLVWVGVDPLFDPLRKEPGFQSLLKKMNLTSGPVPGPAEGSRGAASQPREGFEFESERTRIIFEQLASDFMQDYMLRSFMEEKAGWRSTGDLARETGIPLSSLYAREGRTAAPFRELWKRGLVEMRVSPGERGRGGEVTKLRVAYGKLPVREYVNHMVKVVKKPNPGR